MFLGKKQLFYGMNIFYHDEKYTINFERKKFLFSEKNDVSGVDASKLITKILPDPVMYHRRHYFSARYVVKALQII